jgi:hypothetical protein
MQGPVWCCTDEKPVQTLLCQLWLPIDSFKLQTMQPLAQILCLKFKLSCTRQEMAAGLLVQGHPNESCVTAVTPCAIGHHPCGACCQRRRLEHRGGAHNQQYAPQPPPLRPRAIRPVPAVPSLGPRMLSRAPAAHTWTVHLLGRLQQRQGGHGVQVPAVDVGAYLSNICCRNSTKQAGNPSR